jgi:hypothetical protein
MRSLLIAAFVLVAAGPVQAQDSLPRFVFEGHHIGEARVTPRPDQCKWPGDHAQIVCARETLDGVNFDAAYTYTSQGNLVAVGATVDSVEFKPLFAALTKRYGRPKAQRSGKGHDYAQWRFREGKLHLTRTGTLVVLRFASPA